MSIVDNKLEAALKKRIKATSQLPTIESWKEILMSG